MTRTTLPCEVDGELSVRNRSRRADYTLTLNRLLTSMVTWYLVNNLNFRFTKAELILLQTVGIVNVKKHASNIIIKDQESILRCHPQRASAHGQSCTELCYALQSD